MPTSHTVPFGQPTAELSKASMTFFDTKEFPDPSHNTLRGRTAVFLESTRFEGIIAVALLSNVFWMAVSLQVNGGPVGFRDGPVSDEPLVFPFFFLTSCFSQSVFKNNLSCLVFDW